MTGLGEWSVPVIGMLSVIVWLAVLVNERSNLRRHLSIPVGVRAGMIVAGASSTVIATLSALSFPSVYDNRDLAIMLSALWRATVLVAGVYALIASLHDDEPPSQRPPSR